MAQAYRETTEWDTGTAVNHTYLLEGDQMLAYIRQGTQEEFWFKKPIRIDRRGRRFELVDTNFTGLAGQVQDVIQVKGSKGQTYIVNPQLNTCTCPGYTFRGSCKHVKELETQ